MHLANELSAAKAQARLVQASLDNLQIEMVALRAAADSHADEVKAVRSLWLLRSAGHSGWSHAYDSSMRSPVSQDLSFTAVMEHCDDI